MSKDKVDPKLLPCKTCPWRKNKDAATIPGYDPEKVEGLLNTVGQADAIRPIMACHNSSDMNVRACNGYLAREGWRNLIVRLLLARGKIHNPDQVLKPVKKQALSLNPIILQRWRN